MKEIAMQCTNNSDRTMQLTASRASRRSDTTIALYNAFLLDRASANLASAIRRAADTRTTAKISPKGRSLYSVRRGN